MTKYFDSNINLRDSLVEMLAVFGLVFFSLGAESMYMSTRTLQRRLKDAKFKGSMIGKSTASRKTMSEAKWGKVVDLIDSCDI